QGRTRTGEIWMLWKPSSGLFGEGRIKLSLVQAGTCNNVTLVCGPVTWACCPLDTRVANFRNSQRLRSSIRRQQEVCRGMKERRGGKADGVHAVKDTAVPLDGSAEVFHTAIALDGRHDQAPGNAQERNQQRHTQGHRGRKWRHPP